MNDQRRPKAPHESATTGPIVCAGGLSLDDRLAAFEAGRQQGKAERVDIEIEAAVQDRIQGRVREALGMAQQFAAAKGPAWAALIAECGESDD